MGYRYQEEFNINDELYFTLEIEIHDQRDKYNECGVDVDTPILVDPEKFTPKQLFDIGKFMVNYSDVIEKKFLEIHKPL